MLSTRFRDNSAAEPINSDTKGDVTVYAGNGSTVLTNEAVSVIFAPGAAIQNQIRDAANKNNVLNYLESTSGINNASVTGPYISAQPTATFNDRLLVISTADLMTRVEQRVARELRTILQTYKDNTTCACTNLGGTAGCYPWADLSNGESDAPPYQAVGEGRNRGRIPVLGAAPYDWGDNPCGSLIQAPPSWFVNNDWSLVVYYSAGRNYLGPGVCSTCTASTLTVDATNKEVVILMPGPLLGNPPRAPVPLDDSTYWQYYFEDPANRDFANDVYVTPTSTTYARDRIFSIP